MNILIYNCEYATIALLEKLVEIFKITQIHVFDKNLCSVLCSPISKLVTVTPNNDEKYNVIMDRSMSAIINQISKPIFENGQFVGLDILPTYKQGSKYDFYSNLELDHPNILVLQYGKHYYEKCLDGYGYKSCLTRFISKYDDIDDPCLNHICIYHLSSEFYVDIDDDVEHDFNALRERMRRFYEESNSIFFTGYDKNNQMPYDVANYIPLLILYSLNLNSIDDLFRIYYSIEGFINCSNLWLKELNEDEYRTISDHYDDDTDYQAEMDYIRENGGDWVYD